MTRRSRWMAYAAALLLVTSASPAQERTGPAGTPQPDPAQAARPEINPAQLNAANLQRLQAAQAQQRTATPSEPVVVEVNWDQARNDARRSAAADQNFTAVRQTRTFPVPRNLDRERLAQTEVPILVPTYAALGFSSEPVVLLFPRGDFYTLSITGEAVLVEVFCTRIAHSQPSDPLTARRIRGAGPEGYRSEQTEYGREISFTRYGVAYSITIECDQPGADPRCVAPAYGQGLYQSLQLLPGSRGTPGGQ